MISEITARNLVEEGFTDCPPGGRCYVKNLFATKLYSKESTFSGTVNAMSSFFLGLTHFEIISIGGFLKVDILLLK